MKSALRLLFSLALATSALSIAAQQHPMEARGFAADKVFDVHDIDSVNTFNGNLVLHIPIGPEIRANGNASYHFLLFYNSTSWRYTVVDNTSQSANGDDLYDKFPDTTTYADPVLRANAGFGWFLSLGRLWELGDPLNERTIGQFTYEAPDGSDHDFRSTDPTSHVLTTDDTTYLRLTVVDGSYDADSHKFLTATTIKVEAGDGTYQIYRRYKGDWTFASNQSADNNYRLWRLHEIHEYRYDADSSHSNQPIITIDYSNDATHKEIWTITGGNHTSKVYFNYPPTDTLNGVTSPNAEEVLDKIEMPAFGGGTATYQFHIPTTFTHPPLGDDSNRSGLHLPILTSIDLPGNPGQTGAYQFTTDTTNGTNGVSGSITHVQVPTGGTIDYVWVERDWIPGQHARLTAPSRAAPIAVFRRTITDPSKSSNDPARTATWQYDYGFGEVDLCWCTNHDCPLARDMITSTMRPDGNTDVAYYSVYSPLNQATRPGDPPGTCDAGVWTKKEYGLPFTHNRAEPGGRLRSREIFSGLLNISSDHEPATGYPNRDAAQSTFLIYEYDPAVPLGPTAPNSRVRTTRTYWGKGATGQLYTGSDSYLWDALGHFNVSVASGNILSAGAGTESRVSFTNHTSNISAARYLTNIPTEQCTSDTVPSAPSTITSCASLTAPLVTSLQWDSTGFLTGKRTLKNGATESTSDLLSLFTYDRNDNLATESFYGGDDLTTQNAGSGFTPTGSAQYQLVYTSTYGAGESLTNVKAAYNPSLGFNLKDIDYDPTSGFVSATRDTAGLQTSYEYDARGRLKKVTPPGTTASPQTGAPLTYTYTDATNTGGTFNPAKVVAATTGATSNATVQKDFLYDGLGRLWRESVYLPMSAVSTRETIYDGLGRVSKRSELETTPTHYTLTTYDTFGRMLSVTAPDGHTSNVEYTSGSRNVRRMTTVGTLNQETNNETLAATNETYDSFGRLYSVEDPVHTLGTYSYDTADRLKTATVTSPMTSTQQVRTFTYDGRGFLTSESHPELATTSFGYTYDSRGHVLTRNFFINNQPRSDLAFNLKYTYDAAERLLHLDSYNAPASQWRPIKEFTFAQSNGSPDYAKGKMKTAIRHNYQPAIGDVRVTETYTYGDTAGRMTDRQTDIDLITGSVHPWQSMTMHVDYDELGLRKSITYPHCLSNSSLAPCGASQWTGDLMNYTYAAGHLVGLDYFAQYINYSPNDTVSTIGHTNYVVDTITPDPNGMPRPKSISFSGWSGCQPASIASAPDQTIGSGQHATLTVATNGSSPISIQWCYGTNPPTPISGATGPSYLTDALTSDTPYVVIVSNGCNQAQANVMVHIAASCTAPAISSQSSSSTITAGQSVSLSVTATGTSPLTYAWYHGSVQVGSGSTFQTPPLDVTTTYTVQVSNNCGSVTSQPITLTVPLQTPAGLVATANVSGAVVLTWYGSTSGVHHFEIERRAINGTVTLTSTTSSFTDTTAVTNREYIYRVRAVAADSSTSAYSAPDLASTKSFAVLTRNVTIIAPSQLQEILDAANEVITITGGATVQWPASPPPPASNGLVLLNHLSTLRTAVTAAWSAAQVGTPSYLSVSSGSPITIDYLVELRSRLQ